MMEEGKPWQPLETQPYAWPCTGGWSARDTALLVIDFQEDALSSEGYFAKLGYDTRWVELALENTCKVIAAAERLGISVVYTQELYHASGADMPVHRKHVWAELAAEAGHAGMLPFMQGCFGGQLAAGLASREEDSLVAHPGRNAFLNSALGSVLQKAGVQHLLITGACTEGSVHATMRAANDIGYECLLLEDCCGTFDEDFGHAIRRTTVMGNGIFGVVAKSEVLLQEL